MSEWHRTACILCESNCGIEVRLGGDDGRTFERIRGDKAHPASKGYTCEKALRLNHYQNSRDRLTSPMKRRDDGTRRRPQPRRVQIGVAGLQEELLPDDLPRSLGRGGNHTFSTSSPPHPGGPPLLGKAASARVGSWLPAGPGPGRNHRRTRRRP